MFTFALVALALTPTLLLAQPTGVASRQPVGPFLNNLLPTTAPSAATGWSVVPAFPNLTFRDPTFLIPEPRSTRLHVGTLWGVIYRFTNDPATSTRTVFLDLSDRTQVSDNSGLLGMAFHPEFGLAGSPNRGYVYVFYQYSAAPVYGYQPSYNRLSRFTVPDGAAAADRASELVLIDQYDPHVWHNGGSMAFGPDGFLYVSLGAAGGANESYNVSQRLDYGLFAGVIRIDVDRDPARSHPIRRQPQSIDPSQPSFSGNYYIPNDNPFLDPGGGILEEFWAIGLRSPHRMTLDPITGQFWVGDVGQNTAEEINVIVKGGNYQWAYREGTSGGPKSRPATIAGTEQPPLYAYPPADGNNAIIGGYVYRGTQHAALLDGMYLFGDNGSGRIWALRHGGGSPPSLVYLANMPPGTALTGLSSFGIDHNRELYLLQLGFEGRIYKLARTGSTERLPPARLSETGLFTNLASLTPAPWLVPYDVNSPLWSDGALKRRWVALPNDGAPYLASEAASFSRFGSWAFPEGTVFVKHFELPIDQSNPAARKRLETRLLVRDTSGGVYGLTYKWRADNSDADLLPGSLNEEILIATPTGPRTQTWFYPSRQACLSCHTEGSRHVLGVNTRQLNGNLTYPGGVTDNQLRTWSRIGMFATALNETEIAGYDRLARVDDAAFSIEHRARSYLDVNCAPCHQPSGARGFFDARFDTPLRDQGIVDGPLANAFGDPSARVIAPGSVPHSFMHTRMNTVSNIRMPPLARNEIDLAAINTLEQWIQSLQPTQPLPPPWTNNDVGTVNVAGSVSFASGTYTVRGSGADIWDNADGFHFVHQTWSGDGELVARVTGIQNTHAWAKAGLMFRESLAANARNAFVMTTPGNGTVFQARATTGGTTSIAGSPAASPVWLRIVRAGNTFTGYQSTDGASWVQIGAATISLPVQLFVGLAVTSHAPDQVCAATFDSVTVSASGTPTAPLAPGNLVATAVNSSRIDLAWADNANNEDGFKIERATDGVNFTEIATVAANVTVFSNTSLAASTSYAYRVRAFRAGIDSAFSNVSTAATPALGLAAPTNLVATAASGSRIELTWSDNSTNEEGFAVERSTDGLSFVLVATLAADTIAYSNTGLTAATTYSYRVRATRSSGDSGYSNVASATTPGSTLAAPTALAATAANASRIDLAWTDNSAGEEGFKIERSADGVNFLEITVAPPNATAFANTGLPAGSTFSYRVRATTAASDSAFSNTASATTLSDTAPPTGWTGADIGATAIAGSETISSTSFTVRGSGSDIWGTADAFRFVYRPLSGDGTIVAQVTSVTNTHAWAKAGVMIRDALTAGARNTFAFLTPGNGIAVQNRASAGATTTSTAGPWGLTVPYWVRLVRTGTTVVASISPNGTTWTTLATYTAASGTVYIGLAVTSHDNTVLGTGTFANVSLEGIDATPLPAAPTALAATAVGADQIDLAWTDNANNESGFKIERATDGVNFVQIALTAANATSFSNVGLAASTTFTYRVRATNSGGDSAYSNAAFTTTGSVPAPVAPTNLTATVAGPDRIDLAWADNATNETGYEIQQATDGVTFTPVTTTAANATSFADTGLTAATTYTYRVRAVSGGGNSTFSNTAAATTASAPPPSLEWTGLDIGAVAIAGSNETSGGSVTVRASGNDIWDTADGFRFYHRPLSGGTIVARVASLTNTHPWAKAGVMIRESLSANSANTFMLVSAGSGVAAQHRATAGAVTTQTAGPWGLAAPYWVRLARTGSTIVASASPNGTNWTTVATYTVSIGASAYIGLAVTSHNNAALCTAVFSDVSVSGPGASDPVPAAPTALTATAMSTTRIDLAWTDNASNENGFAIERSTDGATFAAVTTTAANATTFADTGLAPATLYTYRVRAVGTAGNSGYSNTATTSTPSGETPAPSALTATAVSSSRIDLAWTDNATNENGFAIERSSDGVAFAPLASVAADTTAFSNTGLAAGSTFTYRVRATSTGGSSAFSNLATATTPAAPPPPSAGWAGLDIGATALAGSETISGSSLTVRGSGSDIWDTADSFRFVHQALNGDGAIVARVMSVSNSDAWAKAGVMLRETLSPGSSNVFIFLTPSNGLAVQHRATAGGLTTFARGPWGLVAPYWVRLVRTGSSVTASASPDGAAWTTIGTYTLSSTTAYVGLAVTSHTNSALCTALFENVSVTGSGTPSAPAAPSTLTATAVSSSRIDLAWTDNSTGEESFGIERSTDGVTFSQVATAAANATTFSNTGLAASTTYTYRVRALTAGGNSAYSNTAAATTPAATTGPAAPTALTATAVSAARIDLAWTDNSTNENAFGIERSTDGVTFAQIATTAANIATFSNSGLTASTTYTYRVRALSTAGNSGYSNATSATTPAATPALPAPTALTATAVSASRIDLAWADNSTSENAFGIERSTDGVTFAQIATAAANTSTFSSTGLIASTAYTYRVRALATAGNSAYSNTASATTMADAPPSSWQSQDVGTVALAGSTSESDGTVTLTGSGEDIWNRADEFQFRYQSLTGDGEIVARVASLTNTHGWAKAGVMFRETLDAGSRHALMCVSIAHGTAFQYRSASAGETSSSIPSGVSGAPRWVRLVRSGNTITGFESANGTTWSEAGTITLALPATIHVGLAVTSHNDGVACTAVFENVTVSAGPPTPPPPPPATPSAPTNLVATAVSSTQVNLTWTDNATTETGFQIERATDGATFALLATNAADSTGYSDTTVTAGTTYTYRVRTVAGSSASAYSNTASATPTAAPPPPPPPTWSFGDIGAVGLAGSNTSTDTSITISGSGADVWGTADAFRFVYREVSGDGVVEARVASMDNTNGWAKAGVMIREALTAGSRNAFAFVTPIHHGVNAQARATSGGATTNTPGPVRNAPYWVRLTRNGSSFAAASSPDGVTWTTFATFTISMNATAYFGFAVTSHDNTQLNAAVFEEPFVR